MIGETIGNYKIESLLGQGGMGEVYLAEQLAIGTKVAIKVLRADVALDSEHVQRFFNEARAVSTVRHAGIVKIFDVGFHGGHAYLVMEFLDGMSLATRIHNARRVPGAQVVAIGRQIAGVLDAVHSVGITHRDLKPDNIFLVPDHELGERVKILDFGIAKLTGTLGANSPRTHGTMGTPTYMAPEQWKNAASVDGRTDIYSLGCVLFEMACGRPPFLATSTGEACTLHLHEAPPRASAFVTGVPSELELLLDRMLAKAATDRPSIGEVARVLDEVRGKPFELAARPDAVAETMPPGDPTFAPTVEPSPPTPRPRTTATEELALPVTPRRRRWWIGLAGIAVAAASTVVVWRVWSGRGVGAASEPADALARSADAGVVLDAASPATVATPQWRDVVTAGNPLVDTHGLMMQVHQVTYAEHALATAGAPGPHPDDPIAWLTVDQATAFCASIGARLPTSAEWERAAAGGWGISHGQIIGPLQEWTSTVQDGLAVVRGGHSKMTAVELAEGARQHPAYLLQKETPAGAGASATPRVVASPTIGFRCIAR